MSRRKARTMLRANDIVGLMALPPTPLREDVDPFGTESTVDLTEATHAVGRLVADGAKSIGLCGTTGECAAVTWSEKQEYYAAIKDTVAGKVPLFAGATTLGTRDTVEQKVLELQKTKRDLADAIITADNRTLATLKREDLELLLS